VFDVTECHRAHTALELQAITMDQGKALAAEFGIGFLETSAKANVNVEEAFFSLARYEKKNRVVLGLSSDLFNYCVCAEISKRD
jgi:hypothetical protein